MNTRNPLENSDLQEKLIQNDDPTAAFEDTPFSDDEDFLSDADDESLNDDNAKSNSIVKSNVELEMSEVKPNKDSSLSVTLGKKFVDSIYLPWQLRDRYKNTKKKQKPAKLTTPSNSTHLKATETNQPAIPYQGNTQQQKSVTPFKTKSTKKKVWEKSECSSCVDNCFSFFKSLFNNKSPTQAQIDDLLPPDDQNFDYDYNDFRL